MGEAPVEHLVSAINERTINMQTDIAEIREYLKKQNSRLEAQDVRIHEIEKNCAVRLLHSEHVAGDIQRLKKDVQRPLVKVALVLAIMQIAQLTLYFIKVF
jgi:hypothetical protein